ncbi:hypothetical protein INR49_029073 [Caranx melampygus]|nr:hypothetical protein INR49_029073 [Caranx melampygus]
MWVIALVSAPIIFLLQPNLQLLKPRETVLSKRDSSKEAHRGKRNAACPVPRRCLSLNPPCGNHILLRVKRPLAVIRPRRASRCDRGAGGVEQQEPHVNEHLHLRAVCHLRIRSSTLTCPVHPLHHHQQQRQQLQRKADLKRLAMMDPAGRTAAVTDSRGLFVEARLHILG